MNLLQYYCQHSPLSDPGGFAASLMDIPPRLDNVIEAVQGVMIHDYFGAHLYDEPPIHLPYASRETFPVSRRLATLHAIPHIPLTEPRYTQQRCVGTCRDFALLTCAILRQHTIPARVRCGFALYFHPPTYEDHWVCEVWDNERNAWRLVDAQLDAAHLSHLNIAFDPTDVPRDAFLFPWQIWERYQADLKQLDNFGQGDNTGLWFLRVNLARDALTLIKNETSQWDSWRDQSDRDKRVNSSAIAQCVEMAEIGKKLDVAIDVQAERNWALCRKLNVPYWREGVSDFAD